MSDGSRLHDSWLTALKNAQNRFKSLLNASASEQWRKVPVSQPSTDTNGPSPAAAAAQASSKSGKFRPKVSDVVVHRRTKKGDDVIRVVLEVPAEDGLENLESWKAVLGTPEMRKEWDPTVENANIIETCFDSDMRLTRTEFALGWPANPRDAITISRTFMDPALLLDITTSLPRSPDEPAYLRPAPPFVRSHVYLFAWAVQLIPPNESSSKAPMRASKVRITCFWQHDLKALWGTANVIQNLPAMVIGLTRAVRKRGTRVPTLTGWGNGMGIDNISFNVGREALRLDYSVFPEDTLADTGKVGASTEAVDIRTFQEKKRLDKSIEVTLPISQSWDIQITTRGPSDEVTRLPWVAQATKIIPVAPPSTPRSSRPGTPQITFPSTDKTEPQSAVFRITHTRPPEHAILKVKVVVEASAGDTGLRVNGSPQSIQDAESRDPLSLLIPHDIIEDTTSISGLTYHTTSTTGSQSSVATQQGRSPSVRTGGSRAPAAEKAVLGLVRRNYIYFTSLLQEPEAKWRHVNESRGVTISQLDSIDPTLVVYRAEAVFVGIGVWDLLSIIKTPGAKVYWDRGFDDAVLLEDVNELTELWRHTTKAAWPVTARDTVLLSTSYKSPNAVHVFSFSTDDKQLFPAIPDTDPSVIRTQVDLQGWAIEALSPTTTLLTLLDQSDPKGWSNKSSIPQQMIATLAGVGEFAIKCGGPPIATRFGGAVVTSMKYDHDKSTFKVEYEGAESRRHCLLTANDMLNPATEESVIDLSSRSRGRTSSKPIVTEMPKIECELRCDLDTWASTLEVVVDPPPQGISCLKRHRLANGGGGLWITIEHDALFVGDDRLMIVVKKGTGMSTKDKGAVIVNGLKVKVDVEDLPENEVKALTKQKRVKPVRIPLDQPPVLGVIRRRRAEWEEEVDSDTASVNGKGTGNRDPSSPTAPRFSSPLTRLFTSSVGQIASPTSAPTSTLTPSPATSTTPPSTAPSAVDPEEHPIQRALRRLDYLRLYHAKGDADGWLLASDKNGLPVHKKLIPTLSSSIPIHKSEKVIEGISAGEVYTAVMSRHCRRAWDERFVSRTPLEDYGQGCSTSFMVTKLGFPYRDRGFWSCTVTARLTSKATKAEKSESALETSLEARSGPHLPTILVATASFNPSSASASFSSGKVNPLALPIGQLIISGWILNAIDPYSDDNNYPIPSTHCTHFVAVDYRGSVPVATNSNMNAMLPRSNLLALEAWIRSRAGIGAGPWVRSPAPNLLVDPKIIPAPTVPSVEPLVADSDTHWTLTARDPGRSLLSSGADPNSRTFTATIKILPQYLQSLADENAAFSTRPQTISQGRRYSSATTDEPSRRIPGQMSPPGSAEVTPTPSTFAPASNGITTGSLRMKSRRPSSPASPGRPTHQRYPSSPYASYPVTPQRVISGARPRLQSSTNGEPLDRNVSSDPIVVEVVVNPALYPNGYAVQTTSLLVPVDKPWTMLDSGATSETDSLPLVAAVYTIPPTPLLSSSSDAPNPRHLLTLSLPASQFYVPAIVDPLTGETRRAPTKPNWLTQLETNGTILKLKLSHLSEAPTAQGTDGLGKVLVNGKDIPVIYERKSVAMVSREYLEDDGTSYMPLLTRIEDGQEGSKTPVGLSQPSAINLSLVEERKTSLPEEGVTQEVEIVESPKEMTGAKTPLETNIIPPTPVTRSSSQFFNFWNASSVLLGLSKTPSLPTTPIPSEKTPSSESTTPMPVNDTKTPTSSSQITLVPPVTDLLPTASQLTRLYPVSVLIVVAVVSFLVGSLIRSLISPADFIYFTADSSDDQTLAQVAHHAPGEWREVRRLFEFKRGLFGWDLVVAVVRRPPL